MKRSKKFSQALLRSSVATIVIIGLVIAPAQSASAEVALPPKGVSQELWTSFQEVAISNISGAERNIRWSTSPLFYMTGNPTISDNNTFQNTLYEISLYCNNIKPFLTSSDPKEGASFNYVNSSNFKTVIPETPSGETNSYAWTLYGINSGLSKFTAVFSTELPQTARDRSTQIRVFQAMGLRSYTKNLSARMFSWANPYSESLPASELDKQIIRLYCSNYTRSWDTAQQTFDAISSAWTKKVSNPILSLNIKVQEYKNQLNFGFNFDPSQALDNQLTGIQYFIFDTSGNVAKSGTIDVSGNLFKTYEVILSGIKDNSRYKIEAYPLNSIGNGYVSKGEGRAGTKAAPVPGIEAADASTEILDARNAVIDAIDAAIDALAQYERYRATCNEISIDFEIEVQELYDSTNLSTNCEQLNGKVALLEREIKALDPEKAKTTDQANKLTDQANLLAEEADAFVAQIQDITDELAATEEQFISMASILEPLNILELSVIEPWDTLQGRLSNLPSTLVASLKKNTNYKSANAYTSQIQSLLKTRDTQVESLSTLDNTSEITPIINKLKLIKSPPAQLTQFKKSLAAINKLIPASVCQKGSKIVLASKAGKCASGFQLVPTS